MKRLFVLSALTLLTVQAFGGAAEFQNLDFESANLPILPPGQIGTYVPISQAFPGWSAYLGALPTDRILYNDFTLGSAAVTIQGPNSPLGPAIEGNFGAYLQSGLDDRVSSLVGVSLAQTGLIPVDANSIFFKIETVFPLQQHFQVLLGGQQISLIPWQEESDYVLFAGDISAFAGDAAELRFTVPSLTPHVWLDDIVFSPVPVPEPSTWAMFGLGVVLVGWKLRRRQ